MLNNRQKLYKVLKAPLYLIAGFLIASLTYVIVYAFVPVAITPLMILRPIESLTQGEEVVHHHHWVSRSKINKNAALAVVCAEDQNFYHHWGFDLESIQESIDDYKKGDRLRGASSISQQTAKNVFLYPSSTWLRKGLEVYFTFLIELVWTKDRILTVYLNSIEFGSGIYGIEAASQVFYQHPALDLDRSESALLASVLPNPHRFKVDQPSSYIRSRQKWVLRQMAQHNYQLPKEQPLNMK